jgi:hypothetical protein
MPIKNSGGEIDKEYYFSISITDQYRTWIYLKTAIIRD